MCRVHLNMGGGRSEWLAVNLIHFQVCFLRYYIDVILILDTLPC